MRSFFVKMMVVCFALVAGAAHAQWNIEQICVEVSPEGASHCRFKPDTFSPWVHGTGFGGSHPTAQQAADATIAFQGYLTNPSVCAFSYWLGEVEVVQRDRFLQSQEPVSITTRLYVRAGSLSNKRQCEDIKTGSYLIYGGRAALCSDSPELPSQHADLRLDRSGASTQACITPVSKFPISCDACSAEPLLKGNPILITSREKIEIARDIPGSGAMPLDFRRTYRSHRARDKYFWFGKYFQDSTVSDMGEGWIHNYDLRLVVTRTPRADLNGSIDLARIQMGDGSFHYFYRLNGSVGRFVSRQPLYQLVELDDEWILEDQKNEIRYVFDKSGRPKMQTWRNGWSLTYKYYSDTNKLSSVENSFGQRLVFAYTGGKLTRVASEDASILFGYAADLLTSTTRQGGAGRQYVYSAVVGNVPPLLTGVIDEQGVRYTTYQYDAQGWAISTEKAGGVSKYTVSASLSVVDPLGTSRSYGFQTFGHELIYKGSSKVSEQPGDVPLGGSAVRPDGLVSLRRDFMYNDTTYTWDAQRRLPLTVTEASGTPLARTTSFSWHPLRRSPQTIKTPDGGTYSYTYDSLGNVLTQTHVSANGADSKSWSWAYFPSGLVSSETAPNGATTSYQYDAHGNPTVVTNHLGHADVYTYDLGGRVFSHTSPTGLVTAYTYDVSGNVLSIRRESQLTSFTYRASGELASVTLPHGHSITYAYDNAHRLIGWADNRGASANYVLDGMGNRVTEEVRARDGQLAWRLVRSINEINRVASLSTDAVPQTSKFTYDNNGDVTRIANGKNEGTSYGLDSLRRVKTLSNAAGAAASIAYNALDDVTQASDFKGVATAYTRDALGNATTEASPDSGLRGGQYDALGLPTKVTDALGQATTIERDLLGRPTRITHASGPATTLRYDVTPTNKGYLGEIVDASGTTTYQRDAYGRVISKTQVLINGDTRSISYGYNAQGLLASTTYPGGQVLQNVYDATGQLIAMNWAGQPLVTGITWTPLGQPASWSWSLAGGASPVPAMRSYNTAGQLTATEFSSYQYDAAGRITGLTQSVWQPASSNPQDNSTIQGSKAWTVKYDLAGRITQFEDAGRSTTYSYDANGNRRSSVQTTKQGTPGTLSRTYSGDTSHNRLLGFTQSTTAPGSTSNTSVTYQYNAAGDLLSDGLRAYGYDSQGRMESATTGQGADAPQTKYAHNGLGQRVFKTEPLYSSAAAKPASTKTLVNLLADDEDDKGQAGQEQPGFIEQFKAFFSKLWSPATSDAEKLGWSYVYGEDGTLLGEYGSGGAHSAGTAQYLYLPTASGPMPVAAVIKGQTFAIHSDHLNTPRKLTQADGQAAWQWEYSAFGDEQPTTAAKRFTSETTTPTTGNTSVPEVTFNLRYPGQYFDVETKLHYNYFRSYDSRTGRYTQRDPIGLDGGWNRFGYVAGNPLHHVDPRGLDNPGMGPYAVGASVYYYSGGPGHVGVSVNDSRSFGYYPTSPIKTNYELIFPGVPGTVELDKFHQSQPDKAVWLEGSVESVELLKRIIKKNSLNPEVYTLLSNNCTTFVSKALRDSNFEKIPYSIVPLNFIESLERLRGK